MTSASLLTVDRIDVANYPRVRSIVVAPPQLSAEAITTGTFTVIENGERREATVQALPADELRVVLVLDTSGSMKGAAIAAAQKAATLFVAQMPADAQVAVVAFGARAAVLSPFGIDRPKTVKALSSLKVRGQTSLHDGLITGAKLFEAAPADSRRVLLVLSDGGDTASKATLADAAAALTKARAEISVIALATGESDAAALSLLTTSAKGAMASAADPAALNGVFAAVANSVLRRYQVDWVSSTNGPADVRVELVSGTRRWESANEVDYPPRTAASPVDSTSVSGPAAVTVTPPVARNGASPPNGRRWLLIGIASGFASALLAVGVVLWPRPPRRRLAVELGVRPRNEMSGVSKGLVTATRSYFQRAGRGHRLTALLERAGWTMDAPTATVLASGICLATALILLTLSGPVLALFGGAVALAICYFVVNWKADRRSAKFRDQFEAALQIIINSLRSGYGVSQAIETVARESETPISDEFRRTVTESSLGMDQIHSLEACAKRMKCEELLWVSESIEVNREVGGNLSDVLVGIAMTIRSRIKLTRQVHAVSAEGRISAQILLVMPLIALAIQATFNRSALRELFQGKGLVLVGLGGVSMTLGYFWTKKIIRIRY